MPALGTRRLRVDPDVEINMVPIMNMFLVLIPFLLASSSFLHLKAIDTSVPVRAESQNQQQEEEPKKSEIVVTATIKLKYHGVFLSVTSPELTENQLKEYDKMILWNREDSNKMKHEVAAALQMIKSKYPKSNTLILSPADNVIYEDIVVLMDVARSNGSEPLFPVVVVSGELKTG